MRKFASNKKSGYERESAAIGFQYLASVLGPPSAPILLSELPTIMDSYMDKGDVVRIAATATIINFVVEVSPVREVCHLAGLFGVGGH